MATTFKPTGKVPYKLVWIGKSGNVTTDPVTLVTGETSDANVATVTLSDDPTIGFILGNPAVVVVSTSVITFRGKNSLGEDVNGAIVVTVDPATTPPPPPPTDVAGSIGIQLGDEVPQ